MLVCKTQAAIM